MKIPNLEEAKERWGQEKVIATQERISRLSPGLKAELAEEWDQIYTKLASLRDQDPTSTQSQAAIQEWYHFLNQNFTHYSPEMFKGLGQMYVADKRFTDNIDQYGQGLAQFINQTMTHFADQLYS